MTGCRQQCLSVHRPISRTKRPHPTHALAARGNAFRGALQYGAPRACACGVVSALGSHRCVRVYDPLPARPMRLLAPAQAGFNSSVRHNHKTKI